jgi:predicted nucleic acid-binding protein
VRTLLLDASVLLAAIDRLAEDGGVLSSTTPILARAAELAEDEEISVYDAAYAAAAAAAGHRLDERGLVRRGLGALPADARPG